MDDGSAALNLSCRCERGADAGDGRQVKGAHSAAGQKATGNWRRW